MSDASKSDGNTSLRARAALEPSGEEEKLPLRAEALSVTQEERVTGRVCVTMRGREREALVDESLPRERIEIEKVPVNKAARIVEEVALEKIGKEHVETISDKIRRQQVEVDHLGPDDKPIPDPKQQPKASK